MGMFLISGEGFRNSEVVNCFIYLSTKISMRFSFILILSALFFISCNKDDIAPTPFVEIESFDQLQSSKKNGISLVFYYSPSCSICSNQRPALESLVEDPDLQQVNFLQVNNDNHQTIALVFGVNGHPVMVFYKDGSESSRLTGGGHSTSKVKDILMNLLEN